MPLQNKILEALERDARLSPADIAVMVEADEETVKEEIHRMEKEGIILGYKAHINPERREAQKVACLIEVSVQPERGHGFDKIAERIYNYPEVQSVFLVSGGYDLLVVIEGKTMRDIANFVIEKLSILPNVRSTASHFLLKKYKELGTVLVQYPERERIPVSP
ncbi:MAG: Lrp/AsnC family transcriptional regulator [Candidatus Omnitrophota bacterium]|jgi:DNA-binding Lrp family transcriptional regulator|nr:MAG: Lrp/AsnC family transcriptional regulator [Candidatus Omnitrophota bacterium]